MFAMPSPKLCGSVPAYRSSIAFRSAPFPPHRRRTLFARVSCVRAPARAGASCAGAVRAPDCARETEDARLPSVPRRAFFGPSHCFPAQKSRRRPREPPLSAAIVALFPTGQAPWRAEHEIFSISLPEDGRTEKIVTHLSRCSRAASGHEPRFAHSGTRHSTTGWVTSPPALAKAGVAPAPAFECVRNRNVGRPVLKGDEPG